MYIYLNRSLTRLVTYLQHIYVGRSLNSLFINTSQAHYKNKVFSYGECLHANIKDNAQCIACLNIKPNNMILIKFVCGFCDGCPEYNITY